MDFERIGQIAFSFFISAIISALTYLAIEYFGLPRVGLVIALIVWIGLIAAGWPAHQKWLDERRAEEARKAEPRPWELTGLHSLGTCRCWSCSESRQRIIDGGNFYNNGSPEPSAAERSERVAAFRALEEEITSGAGAHH